MLASLLWDSHAKLLAKSRMDDLHVPFQVALSECFNFCY